MKQVILFFTLLALQVTQPTFATGRDVNPSVLKSFQTTFSNAKDAEWNITESHFKVRFELNGQIVAAYYNNEGSLLAVTRNITSHQLPLALQTSLKKGAENAWIADLFEVNNIEGIAYFVTLENADSKVVLKSNGTTWSQYSKTKKD